MNKRELARLVREERERLGLKGIEFAARVGISPTQLSQIENAKLTRVNVDAFFALYPHVPALGGLVRGLPQPRSTQPAGGIAVSQPEGLKGKDIEAVREVMARTAHLWHRGGDVRQQLLDALELIERRNPEAPPPRVRREKPA